MSEEKASASTKGKAPARSVNKKSVEPQAPGRVARSMAQKDRGSAEDDINLKPSNREVPEGSSKRKRSTSCPPPEEAQEVSGLQGLENENLGQRTEPDHSDIKMDEEEINLVQMMENVSLQRDIEGQAPPTKRFKGSASSSTVTAQHTEGQTSKSTEQGSKSSPGKQKKKQASTSNRQRRFSPRLAFLPRTRSQVKKP